MRTNGHVSRYARPLLPAVCAIIASSGIGPSARGDEEVGWIVPSSECTCPSQNILVPPGCTVNWDCTRWDTAPSVLFEGIPVVQAAIVECETCKECCADPPSTTNCVVVPSLCDSRSFSWAIGVGIEGGIELIKARLGADFGYLWDTQRCWSLELGSSAVPPCVRRVYTGELQVFRDRVVKMTHRYRWLYTLGSGCENPGYRYGPWCQSERQSTLTSTWWAKASMRVQSAEPCKQGSNEDR